MKLSDLKKAVDEAVKYAGDTDPGVEVWLKNKMYDIATVGQFRIVPTLNIVFGKELLDLGEDDG